jgi:hypothetical protein
MRVTFVTSDEFDSLAAEVAQLKNDMESLRLQSVPSATPEITDEEIPSEQAVAATVPLTEEQQAAIDAVKKADEEHLRLNTKELPKE